MFYTRGVGSCQYLQTATKIQLEIITNAMREINKGHTKLKQSTFLYTKETAYTAHTKQHA